MALKRISKELSQILPDGSLGYSIQPVDNDVFNCEIKLFGPKESIYDGGTFDLELKFPKDYPFKPPTIRFKTKIYHPDVQENGYICCCNLPFISNDHWIPSYTTKKIMESIISLLIEPNVNEECTMVESKKLYLEDKEKFMENAKEWVKKYAL